MNVKYLAKNPTPVTQTITLRQGLPIGNSGVRSTEAVTVQVPPMSVREILFNENGTPLIEGCVQDLTVTLENEEGTPIDPHSSRRERTTIRNIDGERTDVFVEQARRVYPGLDVETARNLGGTQLLAQFSHLRSARDNTTAIYSPAALNMSFESRADSVYHAARTGQIEIESITGSGYDSARCSSDGDYQLQSEALFELSSHKEPCLSNRTGTAIKTLSSKKTCGLTFNPVSLAPSLCLPSVRTQAVEYQTATH